MIVIKNGFSYFSTITYVMGTQKNHLFERPKHPGLHSAVGNVSDCRSRGRELDPDPVPYFRGD